jgi:hypothetical protein
VEEETAFLGEDERMRDAENGVDRVRIRALGDAAVASARVPGGVEIAAAEMPEQSSVGDVARDAGVFVGGAAARVEMDFETAGDVGVTVGSVGCVASGERFVAGFEDVAEFWVAGP